jgi:hypothetical protein
MEERSKHLTLIVGASDLAENVRRSLARKGSTAAGISSHLRNLRKNLTKSQSDVVIVCVAMDRPTIDRHGSTLQQLFNDRHGFRPAIRSVGLLSDAALTTKAAEIGCDVYVHNTHQALQAVELLAQKFGVRRIAKTNRISRRTAHGRFENNRLAAAEGAMRMRNGRVARSRLTGSFQSPSGGADHDCGASRSPMPPPAFD